MIVFDIEIEKAILGYREDPEPGVQYCGGWRDFPGMGIAVVCTYDTNTHQSRVFTKQRLKALEDYLRTDVTGGFNSRRFDMVLLAANGILLDNGAHFDALEEIWKANGLDPDNFNPRTHGGWGLDDCMQGTFGLSKSGSGKDAPIWWQRGEFCRVTDYCLQDCWLEAKLIQHILAGGTVKSIKKGNVGFMPREFLKHSASAEQPATREV
jgi:hypothetical protein